MRAEKNDGCKRSTRAPDDGTLDPPCLTAAGKEKADTWKTVDSINRSMFVADITEISKWLAVAPLFTIESLLNSAIMSEVFGTENRYSRPHPLSYALNNH